MFGRKEKFYTGFLCRLNLDLWVFHLKPIHIHTTGVIYLRKHVNFFTLNDKKSRHIDIEIQDSIRVLQSMRVHLL